MDIKFSSDTQHLVAACEDSYIYIFTLNNNSYLQMPPKKLRFEHEIPISIDFVDDNKSFLVGTSERNQYKIELPDFKTKNIEGENKINTTMWKLRYPYHIKNF